METQIDKLTQSSQDKLTLLVIREIIIYVIQMFGAVAGLFALFMIYFQDYNNAMYSISIAIGASISSIIIPNYRMNRINQESLNKMAEVLGNPKVTVEDLKNYQEKAKIILLSLLFRCLVFRSYHQQ